VESILYVIFDANGVSVFFCISEKLSRLSCGPARLAALQGNQKISTTHRRLAKWRLNNASFHAAEWSSVSRKLSTNKPLLEARERKASRPWTNGYFNVREDGQSIHRGCTTKTRGATGFRARMFLWRLALLAVIALLLCYRAQC